MAQVSHLNHCRVTHTVTTYVGATDSALTIHAGSSPSWPQGVGSGELGPSTLAKGAADALDTAAYQLAVGEVRPEDVDIEINGRKRMIGRGSFGEARCHPSHISPSSFCSPYFVLTSCQ